MRSYLLVDDNRDLAENLSEILRDQGDQAPVVASGDEALEAIRGKRFDALITDMKMPLMSGAELVHEARRLDPGLAVVVLTAYTVERALTDLQHEGILAVLPKPVPIRALMSLLAAARRDGAVAIVEGDARLADELIRTLRSGGFTGVAAPRAGDADELCRCQPFAALVDLRASTSPGSGSPRELAACLRGLPLIVIAGPAEIDPAMDPFRVFGQPPAAAELLDALERLHKAETPA